MKTHEIGEFGFIERFRPWFEELIPAGWTGIGDDCAVIPANEKEDWVITTDLLTDLIIFNDLSIYLSIYLFIYL